MAMTVADRGPTFAGRLQELRDERGDRPAAARQRAFLRAAADLGYGEPFPDGVAEAAATVERFRSQQAYDGYRHGPHHGLAMAWHAHLVAATGRPADARDLAAQAVRQLTRFSDKPERIQAALVVALTVQATAARASGDHHEARLADQRAAGILAILTERDDTYADDLNPP